MNVINSVLYLIVVFIDDRESLYVKQSQSTQAGRLSSLGRHSSQVAIHSETD